MLVLKYIFTFSKGRKKPLDVKCFQLFNNLQKKKQLQEAKKAGNCSRAYFEISEFILIKFIKPFPIKFYNVEIQNQFFKDLYQNCFEENLSEFPTFCKYDLCWRKSLNLPNYYFSVIHYYKPTAFSVWCM